MTFRIGRRDFIALLGGAWAACPLAARAQQGDAMRRIGMLMSLPNDPVGQSFLTAFQETLQKLGWTDGRDVRLEIRWAVDADHLRSYATELVGLRPDVIVAGATAALAPLKQTTRTIPIVFAQVSDPARAGFVENLAHPSGNITGFALYEYTIAVKWLELLKQIAPLVNRVAVIYDPTNTSNTGQLPETKTAAPSFGVQPSAFPVRNAAEIERAIEEFASDPNSGLILLPNSVIAAHRKLIIALAAKHRLPAVYPNCYFAASGGLASYGVDYAEQFRGAASYVNRILRGAKPGDLPIQFADKYELVINLKTAKALGLDPPISLLARTDELIE